MKESPENIKVGNYVVITRDRKHQEFQETPIGTLIKPPLEYDGIPWKVLANEFPFILTKPIHLSAEPGLRKAIDMRRHDVMKVPKAYADAWVAPLLPGKKT